MMMTIMMMLTMIMIMMLTMVIKREAKRQPYSAMQLKCSFKNPEPMTRGLLRPRHHGSGGVIFSREGTMLGGSSLSLNYN